MPLQTAGPVHREPATEYSTTKALERSRRLRISLWGKKSEISLLAVKTKPLKERRTSFFCGRENIYEFTVLANVKISPAA
jgi:hypothetical protein